MATLSDDLWEARLLLEQRREPGDPTAVFLGELANALAEAGVDGIIDLRIALDRAGVAEDIERCAHDLEIEL